MPSGNQRFWTTFGVLMVLLAGAVAWFVGNLLYTIFWKVLGDWGIPITEAQMTAYIAAHLVPFLLVLGLGGVLAWIIRKQISSAEIQSAQKGEALALPPMTPVLNTEAKLKCSFSMNDPGCVRRNIAYTFVLPGDDGVVGQPKVIVRQTRCDWYRVRVDAKHGNIPGCRGRLLSVARGSSELLSGENPALPFANGAPDGTITIHEGVQEHLDLLAIFEDNRVMLTVPPHQQSSSINWGDMFTYGSDYNIKIAVTAPDVPTTYIDLVFRWKLERNTAEIFEAQPPIKAAPSSPLEIIFDLSNPGRKFWSIETAKDDNGKAKGTFWEYRALIRNNSPTTLRNVKAVVEAIGPMPSRPEPSYFDINKQQLIDLNPHDEALAVIRRWFNPPIVVGMASGTDIYGPIKMTVSANDVPPTAKLFHFDPERTPMIFE